MLLGMARTRNSQAIPACGQNTRDGIIMYITTSWSAAFALLCSYQTLVYFIYVLNSYMLVAIPFHLTILMLLHSTCSQLYKVYIQVAYLRDCSLTQLLFEQSIVESDYSNLHIHPHRCTGPANTTVYCFHMHKSRLIKNANATNNNCCLSRINGMSGH